MPLPELAVHVTDDGRVFIHVGSRFVEASIDELDRILERLAADGGAVVYSRDDPAESPHPIALEVMDLVVEYRLPVRLSQETPEELTDSDL
jgi:hypothetical protein